jgi:hypothetical protein
MPQRPSLTETENVETGKVVGSSINPVVEPEPEEPDNKNTTPSSFRQYNRRMQQRYPTWMFFHHRHRAKRFWAYAFLVLCFLAVLIAILLLSFAE